MHTLTDEDVKRNPLSPLEDALRGESTLVTADELGRRGIATIRLQPGELERELAAFGS